MPLRPSRSIFFLCVSTFWDVTVICIVSFLWWLGLISGYPAHWKCATQRFWTIEANKPVGGKTTCGAVRRQHQGMSDSEVYQDDHAPPNACLTLCHYAGEEYAAKYVHLDRLIQTLWDSATNFKPINPLPLIKNAPQGFPARWMRMRKLAYHSLLFYVV